MTEQAGAEVAPVQQTEPLDDYTVAEITEPTTGALRRLEAEVAALDKAFHWAKAMSKTTMVPEHFQQAYKPRGCTDPLGEVAAYNLAAAVMYGIEIGLSAMQAAQNVFVIHGKPAVYARTMAAQVRAAGYVIEEVEASDEKVVWKGLRDGTWAYSEWQMQRAVTAGYTSNERYQKNPQEMLRAKAIAEVCRIKFQDVLLGMAYSIEELQLEEASVQRVVRQGPRGTAKLRDLAEGRGEPQEPPAEPAPEPAPEAEPPLGNPPGATNQQLTEIRKLYKAKGISGEEMLGDLVQLLQREGPLPNLHELAYDEAVDVIKLLGKPVEDAQ
jgi:hypothetical protein